MSPKVKIIIMSYNRPEYIGQVIDSFQHQTYASLDLMISDNSTQNTVMEYVKKNYPNVPYTRRHPSLSVTDHWNKIISETTAEYFMMFHDDDVMLPTGVAHLVNTLESHPAATAAAGNGAIIRDKTLTPEKLNKKMSTPVIFQNVFHFGQRYFNPQQGGVNPFPGYMYRTQPIKNKLFFDGQEAGKHSDVTFLMKCISQGPIIWTPETTMNYRIHQSNMSVGVDIICSVKMAKFYQKLIQQKREINSQEFIIKNYILWIRQIGFFQLKKQHPARLNVLIKAILGFYLRSPHRAFRLLLGQLFK